MLHIIRLLEAAMTKTDTSDESDVSIIMAVGSMCLFHRNPEMSRLQTAMGLAMDESGATDLVR